MEEVDPEKMLWLLRGLVYAQALNAPAGDGVPSDPSNDPRRYFRSVESGPGIWKWDHYFDVYDRHLAKFRGTGMSILEVGVYGGGSLVVPSGRRMGTRTGVTFRVRSVRENWFTMRPQADRPPGARGWRAPPHCRG